MTVTNYLWSEENYLEEYDESGQQTSSYTNEPGAFGSLITQHKDNQTNYFQYDAQGSTRQLTDSTENITDTFLYDAWGNEIARTGTSEVNFRYIGEAGYYYDSEVDSYYVRRRSYSPITANWLSADPLIFSTAFSGLISFYQYVSNSPLQNEDPSGLDDINSTLPGPCPIIPQIVNKKNLVEERRVFKFKDFGSDKLVEKVLISAAKQKNKVEGTKKKWKIGFIQQVTYDISYFGGVTGKRITHCCSYGGVNCVCKKCAMEYHFAFIETLMPGGKGDRQPATTKSEVLNLLGRKCRKCKNINHCCDSGYKLTVTKTVSPALIVQGQTLIQRRSANVTCAGSTAPTPITREKKIPIPLGFPITKRETNPAEVFDFFGNRFPQKRAIYGVEFKHQKCKAATKRVFGWPPNYEPFNYWEETK